jgi:hypothetical protein
MTNFLTFLLENGRNGCRYANEYLKGVQDKNYNQGRWSLLQAIRADRDTQVYYYDRINYNRRLCNKRWNMICIRLKQSEIMLFIITMIMNSIT